MNWPTGMISRRLTPSRGRKSSPAARTITAECSSPLPIPKRRRPRPPQNFSNTFAPAIAPSHGQGGTPLLLSHGFYNTLSCFIQDRFTENLGPSAPLLRQMFSRFMEGRDPTEFTLREKATFVAQGVMSGKIFELAKPANVSLWKELSSYFAQTGSESEILAQRNGRRDRAGAPHIPDGESRLRTTRLSPFREIRSANQQRKHRRKHAGVERDRADPRRARALHLRFSQPGAVAQMAARSLSAISRRNPAAACKIASAPGSPTRSKTSTASPPPFAK